MRGARVVVGVPQRAGARRAPVRHPSPSSAAPAGPAPTAGEILRLQRTAGNRAVAGMLCGRSPVQRVIDPPATGQGDRGNHDGKTVVHLQDPLTKWRITKTEPPQFTGARWFYSIVQYEGKELGRTERVPGNDKNWALEGDTKAADALKAAATTAAPSGTVLAAEDKYPAKVFAATGNYDFEWWFNFLWNEVPDGAAKLTIWRWVRDRYGLAQAGQQRAEGAPDLSVAEMRDTLDTMLRLGFIPKAESEMVSIGQAFEGPQGESTEYHKHVLPGLAGSGLVYRSDSRAPATIDAHGGSKPRSRLSEGMLADVGMTQPWNPFQDPAKRRILWLRRAKADNDLFTIVSIAVDPREAVKFPLPGELKGPGDRLKGESDTAHLYVIWVEKALNTSKLVADELKEPAFGRGELGAVDVPFDTHLVHALTDRAFAEGNVAYVAGRVIKVELVQPDHVYLRLPLATRRALFEVVRALNGGALTWLVHGTPTAGNTRHQEMRRFLDNPTYRSEPGRPLAPGEAFRPSLADRGAPEADLGVEQKVRQLEFDSEVAPKFEDALAEAARVYLAVPDELEHNEAVHLLPSLDAEYARLQELYVTAPFMRPGDRPGAAFAAGLDGYANEWQRMWSQCQRRSEAGAADEREVAVTERAALEPASLLLHLLSTTAATLF